MRFLIKKAGLLDLGEVEMTVEELEEYVGGKIQSVYFLPLAGDQNIRMVVKPSRRKPNFVMIDDSNVFGYVDGDAIFIGNNNACETVSLTDEQVDIIRKAFKYNILWLK